MIDRSVRLRLVGALTGFTLVATACGGGGDSSEETTTTQAETTTTTTEAPETTTTTTRPRPTTTTTEPDVEAPLRQPLTGEIVDDESELLTRPALAVKIDNANAARRNHTGLARADVVFEEIVEDNNTRFAAVFHTEDADPVGPIRSGRSQDVDLLSPLNEPLFAWSGGNAGVTRLIRESFLTDLNAERSPGYYRGPGTSPNNLYSDTDALWAQTPEDHPGAPVQQWHYLLDDEEVDGEEVTGFDVEMRRRDISWDWDEENGNWVRSMDGSVHEDVTYGPITATNVVVMAVEYEPSVIDRRSPEAQTLGEGLVWIFTEGEYVVGKWSRKLSVGAIKFNDLDGEPIGLRPGNTWIELAEIDEDAGEGEAPIALELRSD